MTDNDSNNPEGQPLDPKLKEFFHLAKTNSIEAPTFMEARVLARVQSKKQKMFFGLPLINYKILGFASVLGILFIGIWINQGDKQLSVLRGTVAKNDHQNQPTHNSSPLAKGENLNNQIAQAEKNVDSKSTNQEFKQTQPGANANRNTLIAKEQNQRSNPIQIAESDKVALDSKNKSKSDSKSATPNKTETLIARNQPLDNKSQPNVKNGDRGSASSIPSSPRPPGPIRAVTLIPLSVAHYGISDCDQCEIKPSYPLWAQVKTRDEDGVVTATKYQVINGRVTIKLISDRIYDIWLKPQGFLSQIKRAEIPIPEREPQLTPIQYQLMPGDCTGNNHIDGDDETCISSLIPSSPDSPNWNPSADINGNGQIDQNDLTTLSPFKGNSGEPF